ncbi:MAG: hypothetical protein NWE84_02235 [Candidatus Bathyarchaeota archaeon]|nr:hypothetical protein [Candidatus Bathyarchaeota archaeon]
MKKISKVCRLRILNDRKAASPAVSMIIITAATVVMILVASTYALQLLIQQQAVSEFSTVQKSILSFDDAVRDIAFDRGGSRSVRFTASFGNMFLLEGDKTFEITEPTLGYNYEFTTAVIKYSMPYTFTSTNESPYIIGDAKGIVSSLTESAAQAYVKQESGSANIFLNYRVRVNAEGTSHKMLNSSITVNYVDVFVIKLTCTTSSVIASDFDLNCKNVGLATSQSSLYTIPSNGIITLSANVDGVSAGDVDLDLTAGQKVIFNLIIAEVRVSA